MMPHCMYNCMDAVADVKLALMAWHPRCEFRLAKG